MTNTYAVSNLRQTNWSTVPKGSGYYRWYFPEPSLRPLGLETLPQQAELKLHLIEHNGMLYYGFYFGIAKSLRERVTWHSAQPLKRSALKSGFLSTFRFSLLALLDLEYSESGQRALDDFMNHLFIEWTETSTKAEAEAVERAELRGELTYPINLQGNKTPGARAYVRDLKQKRKQYKAHWLQQVTLANAP